MVVRKRLFTFNWRNWDEIAALLGETETTDHTLKHLGYNEFSYRGNEVGNDYCAGQKGTFDSAL